MKEILVGISAGSDVPESVIEAADFIELKKITGQDASRIRNLTSKPIYFHLQYSSSNRYLLPSVDDFEQCLDDFSTAYELVKPQIISFHFGLASRQVSIDPSTFMAVAEGGLLSREEIVSMIEKNLKTIKSAFPQSLLLLEHLEFIPDALSKGAYRYIQEADFFSGHTLRWNRMGLLDGIVLDIAHAIITAWNHPCYNGLSRSLSANSVTQSLRGTQNRADARQKITCSDKPATGESYLEVLANRDTSQLPEYYRTYIAQLPLELIREIHVSGAGILPSGVFVDMHKELSDTEIKALETLFELMHGSKSDPLPVTLEFTRSMDRTPLILRKLRDYCTGRLI